VARLSILARRRAAMDGIRLSDATIADLRRLRRA
jgi:hypothetical protein